MGFSTETAGGSTDKLFIAGGNNASTTANAKLATLDVTTMVTTMVPNGTIQGSPELTGNANAELWGFFPSPTSPRIEQINKTSGAALQTFPLTSIAGTPQAWAFAFFGGDFFVFLMRDTEFSTTVHQVNGTTGQIVGATATNTRTIVGAGVSTCAPTQIF